MINKVINEIVADITKVYKAQADELEKYMDGQKFIHQSHVAITISPGDGNVDWKIEYQIPRKVLQLQSIGTVEEDESDNGL